MTHLITRYILHLRCPHCGAGYYAAGPLVLPWCPECSSDRLRPCGVWDLTTEASPSWLQRARPAEKETAWT